ncbi:hypothetical protein D9756_008913 [Leucocoprinus leucothites]|uniref:Uncharacterized protein n=1 Tax=Leucocoprinus leucothites TaxID=201217 RepID=A0A8H5CZL1_9AGAR|nr:hypothetical protein D9756_008913 [Leucoagaricus leucothites]
MCSIAIRDIRTISASTSPLATMRPYYRNLAKEGCFATRSAIIEPYRAQRQSSAQAPRSMVTSTALFSNVARASRHDCGRIISGLRAGGLTLKEWVELLTETANYLVEEIISARKHISPQNIYEVNQLYNAGVPKIASVGLECVGFNQEVYKSFLERAAKFTQSKWKPMHTRTISTINPGSSTPQTNSPGIGVTSNLLVKSGGAFAKPVPGISLPVSPTLLGAKPTGFSVVATGLGPGSGAVLLLHWCTYIIFFSGFIRPISMLR